MESYRWRQGSAEIWKVLFPVTETISSVMAVHIQCLQGNFTHRVRDTNGSEKVLSLLSTAPVSATAPAATPGRVPAFVFSPPFPPSCILIQIPDLMQRVLQGTRGGFWPPREILCSVGEDAAMTGLDRQSVGPSFPTSRN